LRNLLCPILMALTSACVHPIDDARRAGGHWTALASSPSRDGNQDDLWYFDAEPCVAVNGGGQIWTTDDGGTTWTQTGDRPGTFFRAVAFFDDRVGIAANIGPDVYPGVTDATVLYRTVDGGRTWSTVVDDAVPGVCNLHPVDPSTMWASGRVTGPSFVGRTTDAGLKSTGLLPFRRRLRTS